MIHKTISAANELRAPCPMPEGNGPNLWIIRVGRNREKHPHTTPGRLGCELKLFAWTLCASPRETT
jgi:hypothetical protein